MCCRSPWAGSPTSSGSALRDGGPRYVDQLATHLTTNGRRPIRPATVAVALRELHAAGLAAGDDGAWIRRRFRAACATLGTTVEDEPAGWPSAGGNTSAGPPTQG